MAYDGFYGGLSDRASVSELLNQAIAVKDELIPIAAAMEEARLEAVRVQAAIQPAVQQTSEASQKAVTAAAQAKASADLAQEYALQAFYTSADVTAGPSITVGGNGATVTRVTLTADTTGITVEQAPQMGVARQFTLILNQGIGARKVTWSGNVRWADNREPVLSFEPEAEDIVSLLQIGSSSHYYGFFNGGSFA